MRLVLRNARWRKKAAIRFGQVAIAAIVGAAITYGATPRPNSNAMYWEYLRIAQDQAAQSHTSPAAIAFIGDSEIANSGLENRIPGAVNYGLGSDTVDGVALRLKAYDLSKVKTFILEVGVNDFAKAQSFDGIGRRYDRLLSILPPSSRVIAIGILPTRHIIPTRHRIEEDRPRANLEIAAACSRRPGCKFVDLSVALSDRSGRLRQEFSLDGLHLTSAGYDVVWRSLEPIIKSLSHQPQAEASLASRPKRSHQSGG